MMTIKLLNKLEKEIKQNKYGVVYSFVYGFIEGAIDGLLILGIMSLLL